MPRLSDLPYLVVNPPLTDPTAPYHPIAYLIGHAEARGFRRWTAIDANIEALEWAARPPIVLELLQLCREILEQSERCESLSFEGQARYRIALSSLGLEADSIQRAIQVFRDGRTFYDFDIYSQAADVMRRWQRLWNLYGRPGQFLNFRLNPQGPVNLRRLSDLTSESFGQSITAPFRGYVEQAFADSIRKCGPALVGISIAYRSQLPFALELARAVRREVPDALLCAGGTDVTDVVKNLCDPSDLWRLFSDFDALVAGEGESAFVALLEAAERREQPKPFPGLLTKEGHSAAGVGRYENVSALGSPQYRVFQHYAYWSPEPVLSYSPTRGCYWNRCTFCDYGLNDGMPTSPSRERSLEAVVTDLRSIRDSTTTMYLAVDAISPSFLRKLCGALAEHQLGLAWSAEIRLERTLSRPGAGDMLKRGGCVALSYGLESGSQRVLDLIDKGIDLQAVPDVLREMRQAGIASQMMCFTGFPGESLAEAHATFRFLRDHADLWSLAGTGEFMLTPGAIVARQPEKFGVFDKVIPVGDDIAEHVLYHESDGGLVRSDRWRTQLARDAKSIRRLRHDRPFVGGIDTAHTILYAKHFGAEWFETPHHVRYRDGQESGERLTQDVTWETPFERFEAFCDEEIIEFKKLEGYAQGIAYGIAEFDAWLSQSGPTGRSEGNRLPIHVGPSGRPQVREVDWFGH